jgi:hypothetical protein
MAPYTNLSMMSSNSAEAIRYSSTTPQPLTSSSVHGAVSAADHRAAKSGPVSRASTAIQPSLATAASAVAQTAP